MPAIFVHGIFTWGDDSAYGFAAQRSLRDERPVLLVDRRGYGRSPDAARSDFDIDTDDLVALLGTCTEGAHLVGHSTGGLVAMLAAARRPHHVRSLALIQPAAFRVAQDHPAIRGLLERVDLVRGDVPPEPIRPEDYLRQSTEGMGMPMPEPTAARLRAVRTSMGERPIWEAHPDLRPWALEGGPTLVVTGTWDDAPDVYRRYVGEPLLACADAIVERLGARQLSVPGYYPHTQQPSTVNAALRELWAQAEDTAQAT